MHPIFKSVLICIGGLFLGSMVNMATLVLGTKLFGLDGIDVSDPSSFQSVYSNANLPFKYFLVPLLAHAFGTFVGALFVTRFVPVKQIVWPMIIGLFFLMGGYLNLKTIPHPDWFMYVDLICCYIPMAMLGYWLGKKTVQS